MKNIFNLSVILLLAVFVTACNQNEELDNTPMKAGNELNVTVTAGDFQAADAGTRATETGYQTTFVEGDKIGVYVIAKDGKTLLKNLVLTRDAEGVWGGNKLYYYKDAASYIAYYPYTENLTMQNINSEEDIVSYFTSKLSKEQNSKEAYSACDVLTAPVDAATLSDGGKVTFNFAHKLSMIEVKVPVREYVTGDDNTAAGYYEYNVPISLELTIGEEKYTPYAIDKGVYRCIVAPTATDAALSVEGLFYDGDAPVTFSKDGIELASGNYKRLKVNYTYEGYNRIRPITYGDYYYADGNIYPGDLANAPSANCIGMIYATVGSGDEDEDFRNKYHYYVMALDKVTCAWATDEENVLFPAEGDNTPDFTVSNAAGALADMQGYVRTRYVVAQKGQEANWNTIYPAFYNAVNFGEAGATAKYKAPVNTSGWFLPSGGQFVQIYNNLNGDGTDLTSSNIANRNALTSIVEAINGKFTLVGGTELVGTNSVIYWTSVEKSATHAYLFDISINQSTENGYDAKFKIDAPNGVKKSSSTRAIRPILAF